MSNKNRSSAATPREIPLKTAKPPAIRAPEAIVHEVKIVSPIRVFVPNPLRILRGVGGRRGRAKRRRRGERGFTLFELLLVVTVVNIFAFIISAGIYKLVADAGGGNQEFALSQAKKWADSHFVPPGSQITCRRAAELRQGQMRCDIAVPPTEAGVGASKVYSLACASEISSVTRGDEGCVIVGFAQ